MFIKKIIILVTLCFVSIIAFAQPASDQLLQILHSIQSIQSSFTQSLLDKSGKTLQRSQGKMFLSRPGKFRWQVTSPNAQLIIANEKKIWIYEPDLQQVTIRSIANEAGEAPALLLSNTNISLQNNYLVQRLPNNTFLLTPKKKGSMFSAIRLTFNGSMITQMILTDHLGQNTRIQFQNVKMNAPLSASLFSFKPPANVDVIDETRR